MFRQDPPWQKGTHALAIHISGAVSCGVSGPWRKVKALILGEPQPITAIGLPEYSASHSAKEHSTETT
ncbi:MAG: hypothetical protein K0S58_1048 [Nitrospira sp.]|jgi:hypothetical protein|nr:hypothetical protein [Nitrospira sp.]